ncbi:MAG: GSCFA domain-containing protein [Bacteroidaceae bacterium]|nr:GSCFA domain-containing protein [Bacteroidaceae bacterium]
MEFRTPVEWHGESEEIKYSDHVLLMGSCFAENVGGLLLENKFSCDVNPFGILYNPLSIAKALRQMLDGKVYTMDDLFESGGQWHSWMHHSSFSSADADECLNRVNSRLEKAASALPRTSWLIMTWGTAFVYEKDSEIVGNCHKQPDRLFTRRLLDVDTIYREWNDALREAKQRFPGLKVMLSVSPIRHLKDGLHGNQISKSVLLLAIDRLCRELDFCHYFPSYEIVMDELRDYRFYAEDMLHPSPLAVKYIWECFCSTYMSKDTQRVMKEWADIQKGLAHRPFNPDSDAYRRFLSQIVLKIEELKEKFPYFEVQKELEQCRTLLNT